MPTKELIEHILRCVAVARLIEQNAGIAEAEKYLRIIQHRWKLERPFLVHTLN